jgi:hypothetical protein
MSFAEGLAAQALKSGGIAPIPPIDLMALAAATGVVGVVELQAVEDGRVETTGAGPIIVLRQDAVPERKRFTLAHEIAHLLLREPDTSSRFQRALPVLRDEERLCDNIAAALLMPADWTQRRFRGRPRNLSTLRHLAHLAECSMSASLARLNELTGWCHSLLRFERYDERWRLVGEVGVPPALHGCLRSNEATSQALDNAASKGIGDRTIVLPLRIRDEFGLIEGQGSVGPRTAVFLTQLPVGRGSEAT